jgi:alpha-beta hydrolase superfamily lysophospholipase
VGRFHEGGQERDVKRRGVAMTTPIAWLVMAIALGACTAGGREESALRDSVAPRLGANEVIAKDGYRLPLRRWSAESSPRAVVLAAHGFNDHAGSFAELAEALAPRGITLYAHDQRGFGATARRGIWQGHERLVDDLELVAKLLRERHPEAPFYLVGNSMGAAVVLLALADETPPPVDGSVLISPAVWGFDAMPWYQRQALWLGVRLFPSQSLPSRWADHLDIEATDDPAIKREMAKDPLILRHTRVDTLHGLARTMDLGLEAGRELPAPALILYGEEDQIIPAEAICALLGRLPNNEEIRQVLYPHGYHMLTRYTRRDLTEADIGTWLLDTEAELPSGHEVTRQEMRRVLCRD